MLARFCALVSVALYLIFLSSPVSAGRYRCTCCEKHFKGRTQPVLPVDVAGKRYKQMHQAHQYNEIVNRFAHDVLEKKYSYDDVGYAGDAFYALASINSGGPDPNRNMIFIDSPQEEGEIAHDLRHIKDNFSPRLWSRQIIELYGNPALCIINEYRKEKPRFWGYYARYISILTSMGRFNDVLKEVRHFKESTLDIDGGGREFFPMFTEQYVARGQHLEAARFLATVQQYHGLDERERKYWLDILFADIDSVDFSISEKLQLKRKIENLLPAKK